MIREFIELEILEFEKCISKSLYENTYEMKSFIFN